MSKVLQRLKTCSSTKLIVFFGDLPPLFVFWIKLSPLTMASHLSLTALPTELTLEISKHLPRNAGLSLSATCKRFRCMLGPTLCEDISVTLPSHISAAGVDPLRLFCTFTCSPDSVRLLRMFQHPQSLPRQFIRRLVISVSLEKLRTSPSMACWRVIQSHYGTCDMCDAVRELCWNLKTLETLVVRMVPSDDHPKSDPISFDVCIMLWY